MTKRNGGVSRTATMSAAMNWPSRMPGVETFGRKVDELFARRDLHLDLGIGPAERGDQRLQEDRHRRRAEPRGAGVRPGAGRGRARPGLRRQAPRTRAWRAKGTARRPRSGRRCASCAMKSAAPTRASSARTAWLIAEGVTPSSAAALRKLRCSATLRKASTPSSAPCRTVKFCFMTHPHYRE